MEDDVYETRPSEDHTEKLIELRKKLDIEVKQNVSGAQKRMKKHYDAKHQQGSFSVDQVVLVKNMKKLSKKGDKMDPNWTGPYEVAECLRRRTGNKHAVTQLYLQQYQIEIVQ